MDLIERALLDLQEEKITSQPSDRLIRLRKDLRLILEFAKSEVMTIFGEKLLSAMATCFQPGKKRSTVASLREQAQTKFVSLRIGPLRDIWACLYCALGIAFDDPILSQSVNRRLFEAMLLRFLRAQQGADEGRIFQGAGTQVAQPLSGDEENALKYAAGFVPFKLLNKYTKRKEDYKGIIECLRNLSVEFVSRVWQLPLPPAPFTSLH